MVRDHIVFGVHNPNIFFTGNATSVKTTFQQMFISVHKFKVILEATDVLHFIVYSNSISYDVRKALLSR